MTTVTTEHSPPLTWKCLPSLSLSVCSMEERVWPWPSAALILAALLFWLPSAAGAQQRGRQHNQRGIRVQRLIDADFIRFTACELLQKETMLKDATTS